MALFPTFLWERRKVAKRREDGDVGDFWVGQEKLWGDSQLKMSTKMLKKFFNQTKQL